MTAKKVLCTLLLPVLLFATVGCGGSKTSDTEKKATLTVGLMPDVDSVPFVVAREKGYFAEEGISVDLVQFKSAQERDSALQSEQLDGAISDLSALCFFKDGGFDVTAVSATDGSYKLIAKKDGATGVDGLVDKDVALSKNTIIEYVTDRILADRNIDANDVNKVVIPQIPVRLEMLQNGKVDAATLPEPMATLAVADGGVSIAASDELGINPGIFVATRKAVTEKKNDLQAMYRAYDRAVDYLNSAPREDYIEMVVTKVGFPSAARENLTLPNYRKAVLPPDKDVEDINEWRIKNNLGEKSYGYDELVTNILH